MSMENLYREVITLNAMADDDRKRDVAKAFFEKLNFMEIPEYFNWASEIFEAIHVKERGDKNALIWEDLLTAETKSFTYQEFCFHGNQCLNIVRKAGVEKGESPLESLLLHSFSIPSRFLLNSRFRE